MLPNRTGTQALICPVISKTMTQILTVWVTEPEKAAAPTVAYMPGMIIDGPPSPLKPMEKMIINHKRS